MTAFICHDCGEEITDGAELWLAHDGRADDADGEPYHPGCATPLGLAA